MRKSITNILVILSSPVWIIPVIIFSLIKNDYVLEVISGEEDLLGDLFKI